MTLLHGPTIFSKAGTRPTTCGLLCLHRSLRFTITLGNPKRQEETAPNPVARTIHQAGEQCDVVLIDANPLPISANTEYLARYADATVLVVESGVTTKQELDRAAGLLERLEVPGVAVILNKISLDRADRAMKREFNRYEQSLRKRRTAAAKGAARRSETKV